MPLFPCLPMKTLRRGLVYVLMLAAGWAAAQWWTTRDMASGAAPSLPVAWPADAGTRPRVLYFWASWCRICRLNAPAMDVIGREYPLMTVALQSGDRTAVLDYLRRLGHDWPVLNDPDGSLARRFGVYGVPAIFVLDAGGRIRYRLRGYTPAWALRLRLWWLEVAG